MGFFGVVKLRIIYRQKPYSGESSDNLGKKEANISE